MNKSLFYYNLFDFFHSFKDNMSRKEETKFWHRRSNHPGISQVKGPYKNITLERQR